MSGTKGYTATAMTLHWGSAAIWLVAWCIGFIATHWRDEFNPTHSLTFLHKALASTLIFLVVVRLLWRATHPAPALPDSMSVRMKLGAVVGHVLLYALALVFLPLSGWYWSSVADKPIMVLGLLQLPPLVAPDQDQYTLAKFVHTYTSWFCAALVAGHVGMALKHHFVDRDEVLSGMLPGRKT